MEYKKSALGVGTPREKVNKTDKYIRRSYYKAIRTICQALIWIVSFLILGVVGGIETGSIGLRNGGLILMFLILSLFYGVKAVNIKW